MHSLVLATNTTQQGCGGWSNCLGTHSDIQGPLVWFDAWNATVQPKLDRLLATSREQEEGWSKDNGECKKDASICGEKCV